MSRIRVDVIGLSLWVRRKDRWEVFFPVKAGANEQHEPYLTICGSTSNDCQRTQVRDHTVHLSGVNGGRTGGANPDWMFSLKPGRNPLLNPGGLAANPSVVGMVQLPLVPIDPKESHVVGPIAFNGREDLRLGYGTTAYLRVDGEPLMHLTPRKPTVPVSPKPLKAAAADVHVIIENLTQADLGPACESTKHGEHLYETDDLLQLLDMRVAVPRYFGPDLDAVCFPPGMTTRAPLPASPTRLCPQGFCEDCD
jgi:hypothetical protein